MRREERIREARRRTAEAERLHTQVTSVVPDEGVYLGRVESPGEWRRAGEIARQLTIAAARKGQEIRAAETRRAVYEALGMLVVRTLRRRVTAGVMLSQLMSHGPAGRQSPSRGQRRRGPSRGRIQ